MSALLSARVIFRTWQTPLLKSLKIQNTQEIKRTLFYSTKQDKTCKFSRKSSFSTFLSCFVQLKSVLLISCVFWIFFSEHLQSTLFQIFFSLLSLSTAAHVVGDTALVCMTIYIQMWGNGCTCYLLTRYGVNLRLSATVQWHHSGC